MLLHTIPRGQMRWLLPALRRYRQEDQEFSASLHYPNLEASIGVKKKHRQYTVNYGVSCGCVSWLRSGALAAHWSPGFDGVGGVTCRF